MPADSVFAGVRWKYKGNTAQTFCDAAQIFNSP